MFRSLIGKGHAEFATKRQQDAQEFFLHVIDAMEQNSRNGGNPCDAFKVRRRGGLCSSDKYAMCDVYILNEIWFRIRLVYCCSKIVATWDFRPTWIISGMGANLAMSRRP